MLSIEGRAATFLKLPGFQVETEMYSLHQGGCQPSWSYSFASLFYSCVMIQLTKDAYLMCALRVTLEQSPLI